MAGLLVVRVGRGAVPGRATSSFCVLVAVVVGLLLGAMSCAAGLADGHAHAAPGTEPSTVDDSPSAIHATHTAHTAHTARVDGSDPDREPYRRSGGTAAESHPGMACATSVELRFPLTSVAPVASSCGTTAAAMTADWSADIEPPVPRSS